MQPALENHFLVQLVLIPHIVHTGLRSELTHPEVIINKFLECQRKLWKGISAKNQRKGVIFGGKIRDKGVAFILWDKHESKHSPKCSRREFIQI